MWWIHMVYICFCTEYAEASFYSFLEFNTYQISNYIYMDQVFHMYQGFTDMMLL